MAPVNGKGAPIASILWISSVNAAPPARRMSRQQVGGAGRARRAAARTHGRLTDSSHTMQMKRPCDEDMTILCTSLRLQYWTSVKSRPGRPLDFRDSSPPLGLRRPGALG
eukprot:scaffold3362_cov402-Prasinococcus_capsulatus_cf.AAC.1